MLSSSMILPVLAALIGILAVYRGGQGNTRVHFFAATAGAIVILCISVLPFIVLAAFGSFGGTASPYEPIFVGYSILATLSILTAIACLLRLTWPRSNRRGTA